MDRRLAGALLVAAVSVAAAIVPVLSGVRLAGTAIPIALPADPAVGDCVIELPVDEGGDFANGLLQRQPRSTSGTSLANPGGTAIPVSIGPCSEQPVLGEVAAMGTLQDFEPTRRTSARQPTFDCRTAAFEYAGLKPVGGRFELPAQPVDDPVAWNLSVSVADVWVLPSPLIQAAGKTWAACVVTSLRGSYIGRFANAYSGGRLPVEFGACWGARGVGVASYPKACMEPHLAEVISVGTVGDHSTTNPDEVRNSCSALAAKVMRRADPTDSGKLSIEVTPNSFEQQRTIPSVNIVCYVVPVQQSVVGSLVGVSEQPIQYTD